MRRIQLMLEQAIFLRMKVFFQPEQTENFIKGNMEIDSDGDDDYSKSSEDGDQGDDKGER